MGPASQPVKGRGAIGNPAGRYELIARERADDGWEPQPDAPLRQELLPETARSIITRNDSPDVPFSRSINPYRGCEHGCIYCYARPSHAWIDLSPGLDFETRIRFKTNAAQLLERELRAPGYRCEPITIGANTDPYQPAEAELGIVRSLLELCLRHRQPVSIITKSARVLRDADLLAGMAEAGLAQVFVSVTTLDDELKRRLEPRTASGRARIRVVQELARRGIPVGVLVAPVIPMINDAEIERILEAAAAVGARCARWILLRLPWEVLGLFKEWLGAHYPERADHVMSLLKQSREGRENDPRFGHRMRGSGAFADLIAQRFRIAARRLDLDGRRWPVADTTQFIGAPGAAVQLSLL